MSDDSTLQELSTTTTTSRSKKFPILLFFLMVLLLLGALIGLYMLGGIHAQQRKAASISTTPTAAVPTVAVTLAVSPTASASPTLAKSSLAITVVNGSGVGGVAQRWATLLRKAGYTDVTIGNAKTFDYKGITLLMKKSATAYQATLTQDITSADSSVVIQTHVDDTITSDVQVIVGK